MTQQQQQQSLRRPFVSYGEMLADNKRASIERWLRVEKATLPLQYLEDHPWSFASQFRQRHVGAASYQIARSAGVTQSGFGGAVGLPHSIHTALSKDIDLRVSGIIPLFSSSFSTALEVLKETTKVKLTHHNKASAIFEPYRSTSIWAMRRCVGVTHLQRVFAKTVKPGMYIGASLDTPFVDGKMSPEVIGARVIYMPTGSFPSLGWNVPFLQRGMLISGFRTGALSDLSKLATSTTSYTFKWSEQSDLFLTASWQFDINNIWKSRRPGFRLTDPPPNSFAYNGCASLGFVYPLSSTAMVQAHTRRKADETTINASISDEFDIGGFGLQLSLSGGAKRSVYSPTTDYQIGIGFGFGL